MNKRTVLLLVTIPLLILSTFTNFDQAQKIQVFEIESETMLNEYMKLNQHYEYAMDLIDGLIANPDHNIVEMIQAQRMAEI